jgi:two-component system invasion response regulator UvrY
VFLHLSFSLKSEIAPLQSSFLQMPETFSNLCPDPMNNNPETIQSALYPQPIRLLIVDDHAILRENWRYIFDRDDRFEVIGECDSAEQAIEVISARPTDVVMMDINLPGMNGLDATGHITRISPATRIIGVSLHAEPIFAEKMMELGASGYVTKNSGRDELIDAILLVHNGGQYVCEEVRLKI